MKIFLIEEETFIPSAIDAVWTFFSDPDNLQKISPEYLRFRVVDCPDVAEIYNDMRIEYRVSPIMNVPLKWVTLIKSVEPLKSFVDTQLTGPYSLWEHTHTFEEKQGGVLMKDSVRYRLPFGPIGLLAHTLFVKRQLKGIFNYRRKVIAQVFGTCSENKKTVFN